VSVSRVESWRASPAHFRAVVLGVLGVSAALLFRIPAILVLATPFAFVAVWSTATRPDGRLGLTCGISPRTIREGEAITWGARLTDVDDVDHVIAFAPERSALDRRPRSGVAASARSRRESTATVAIAMRGTHWGRHDLGPINVVAVSSWCAFRWKALDVGHQVTALPLPEVFDAAASQHRANGLVGLNRSSRPGEGGEFSGIRLFQTGDRLRRINWQRSLRSGELHVTSTYADQDTHVALFVDALADFGPSEGIDGAASSLDTTVRAAGAIAEHFLLRGDRVSLHIFGSRGRSTVPPASGRAHLRRILELLATIEPDSSRAGAVRIGRTAIPGDALAIMLSPLISPVALERAAAIASHGLTVAVVDTLPENVHSGDDVTTELAWRIRLLERRREVRVIEQVGVPVIVWRGPGSLDPFLREIARRAAAPRMARR
jgi:uncharacterized protein (DUF58 family)